MARTTPRFLTLVQSAKLIGLIEAEYVSSKMGDTDFAAHATKVLGFNILDNHVSKRRDELDIPTNGRKGCAVNKATQKANMVAIQELMAQLEKRIDVIEKTLYRRMAQVPMEYTEVK